MLRYSATSFMNGATKLNIARSTFAAKHSRCGPIIYHHHYETLSVMRPVASSLVRHSMVPFSLGLCYGCSHPCHVVFPSIWQSTQGFKLYLNVDCVIQSCNARLRMTFRLIIISYFCFFLLGHLMRILPETSRMPVHRS